MKFNTTPLKVLLTLLIPAVSCLPSSAEVKVHEGNGVNITMENDLMKLNITVQAGGRISQFINKKTGHDFITAWSNGGANGGALDDRNVFTALGFRGSVVRSGGKMGRVRLRATHPNGMAITKTLILRDNSSTLEVQETFTNGTQKPATLMLRNFILPGGSPQTAADEYMLPLQDQPLKPLTPAKSRFNNLAAPWSGLWNSKSNEGILVAAPGIEQFYFWQGSDISPTYEWVYPAVPAGKSLTVDYSISILNTNPADWTQRSAAALKNLSKVRFADIPGWENEVERYKVTAAEQQQGFWLSTGDGSGKRRLPAQLHIDVPLDQSRSIYIALNALTEFTDADLQIQFTGIPAGLLETGWQVSGKDFIKVLPFQSSRKIQMANGSEGRLWLTLHGASHPTDVKGQLQISLNGKKVLLPLEVKVWPVRVPAIRPFDVRAYSAYPSALNGSHTITPGSIKQMNALMGYLQKMGGNVLDWTVSWPAMFPHLKIAGTAQTASVWLKENRTTFLQKPVAAWPQIDFHYYQPWLDAAKSHGMTRGVTYLPLHPKSAFTALEEEWVLRELKRYFEEQQLTGFFCKISDEIASEKLPDYIEQAKLARRAGWRPFTTVTGTIARTPQLINQINPYLDECQLNKMTTQLFDDALHQSFNKQTHTLALPTKFGTYKNGGARDTFGIKLFDSLIPGSPATVVNMQVFQDGKPLKKMGGSSWGNKERGVFYAGFNDYLYLSPVEGTDASHSKFTLRYTSMEPTASGAPLAKIDTTDEVWFYGGPGRPYTIPYESSVTYPLKAVRGNYSGYGWYAFYGPRTIKVLWYDEKTGGVSVSPAYLGLKDGWNDACLLAWLDKSKKVPVSNFISSKADAPLRVGDVSREVYRWKNIVNLTDPLKLNDVRRQMLEAAVK